jgi:conjugal transfer mating pair stabilization protein TraN
VRLLRLRKRVVQLARQVVCGVVSSALILNPLYRASVTASALAILSSPLAALAQTRPSGAEEGQALGESLLHGPTTDGTSIFFQGSDGAESINTADLFQSSGSVDDVQAMMDAFGDEGAATALTSAVAARLAGENSRQAEAVQTVRQSALSRSHPDLVSDPVFNRSESLLDGDDPIFDSFFEGCESTEIPVGEGSGVHVPDYRYCSRVVTPVEQCEITHEYDAGLLLIVGGEGGILSCGDGCLDVYVGRVGDNYWTGNCSIFEQEVRIQVDNGAAITSAVLQEARWDDYMQILIGGERVWQGPNQNFPPETPGPCELRTNWVQTPNVDLTSRFQQNGLLEFLVRVSVTRGGEGYARIRILYDAARVVTLDRWNISPECDALIDGLADGACSLTSLTCLDGPPMDVPCLTVNGFEICQGDLLPGPIAGYSPLCRRGEIVANCRFTQGPMECWVDPNGNQHCPTNDGGQPDGCAVLQDNPSCGFVESQCLPFAMGSSGRCYAYQEEWDCGYDVEIPGGTSRRITCDGPIRCMGEECVSPPREANPDFGRAAATLSAMTFMAMEMDCTDPGNPDSCQIFAGEPMECKQALGGYQDCCNVPVGVGLADYLKLTMASYDLAQKLQLGERLANAGLNVPGAWNAVRNFASQTWSTITQPFTSSWGSLAQSYGGAAVDALESFSLDALKQELMTATAEFVSNTFGPEVASMFFTQTGTDAAGEAVYGLSETFATALNVIMWVYTIYLILNILIDIIWACEEEEFLLAARREMLACTRIGTYCATDSAFGCIETRDAYCCYDSPLGRIVMEGASTQFSLDLGTPEQPNCQGLTIAQVAALNWDEIDLGQWYGILAANGVIPNSGPAFDASYALENVTRNQNARTPAPNAPERIQAEVDAAQYFDEAREQIREDLWDGTD